MSFDLMTLPETTLHYRLILGTSDQPTFIFENGYGQDLSTWQPIMDQVEGLGTILMYDRTNIGGSMPYDSETSRQSVNRFPVVVLSAGKKDHYLREAQLLWHELQRQTAAQSIQGLLIEVPNSRHFIQQDAPHIVVDALHHLTSGDS